VDIAYYVNVLSLGLPQLVVGMVIFFIAKKIHDVLSPFDNNHELFTKNNTALGIATAGYYLGVVIAITGALTGPTRGLFADMRDVAVYGILAIVFLNVARWITDKLILYRFRIDKELIEDQNAGTAWVMFGIYFANGIVVRGAIIGESSSLLSGIASTAYYFVLAQFVLVLAAMVFQWLTPYDLHKEIEEDNVAAGLALGGFVAALGVIVGSAVSGTMAVNVQDTLSFAFWTLVGLVVLTFTYFIVADRILVPGYKLSHEIATKNQAAGWILVVTYQAMAWIFVLAI